MWLEPVADADRSAGGARGKATSLAQRIRLLDKEIHANERQLRQLVSGLMPPLLGEPGVGPIGAAHLIVAWSHEGRADPKPNSPPVLVA